MAARRSAATIKMRARTKAVQIASVDLARSSDGKRTGPVFLSLRHKKDAVG